ncbi:hypothetical protein OIC43_42125 [Streptomyces sp. NBC_00825]|uniref:hypothetical protein n=1 Tax=unclassified Streptomyces TaxID=2593676 RepID=UPI002ED3D23B|nr:hypothetical protein OG832_01555 [Streptomyces sp. NBC_00826]WTH95149.1 hypothetical protein OIC43_42125 [Streptomyces sp. NBC_00825]WTI03883.1 hypothetical protein OHA23_42100 [Streptomyces sp. NBC_00822]
MSSLALLILLAVVLVLVLVVVIVLTMGCLAYVTHHHPSLGTPLTVAIGGASFLIACVAVAVAAVAAVLITR